MTRIHTERMTGRIDGELSGVLDSAGGRMRERATTTAR